MKRISIFYLLVLFSPVWLQGQTETGNIETYLNAIISDMPGSSGEDYDSPSNSELTIWESIVSDLVDGQIASARLQASNLDYQITEFIETTNQPNEQYYILEEPEPNKYWGTFVFNADPCRKDLVIQSTHPRYDTNTGAEAVYCFKRLSAAALFFSGTHRCNHSSPSSCSGTTSACNSTSQSFRISDMAHNTESAFQRTTEIMAAKKPNTVYVQLHGFAKNESDPYVIMSNGTRETPAVDYAEIIKQGLIDADQSLTFKLAHIDQNWTRLIGFTNTQGRVLNESVNPCSSSANSTTGRFIHIEQEKSKLRENSTGWNKMYLALASSFECEDITDVVQNENNKPTKIFPNPVNDLLTIETKHIQQIKIYTLQGVEVFWGAYQNSSLEKVDMSQCSSGPYLVYLLSNNQVSNHIIMRTK